MTQRRAEVHALLGYDLPESAWEMIASIGLEEDLDLGFATPEEIAERVHDFMRPSPAARRPPLSDDEARLVPGAEQLRARSRAIGAWMAKAASEDPLVQAFRHEHLGAALLTDDAIASWVADQYHHHQPKDWPVTVDISTDENAIYRAAADVKLAEVPWVEFKWLERSGETWVGGRWPVPPGSTLASLAKLAGHLHEKWRWRDEEAVVFVLTSLQPEVRPIDGTSNLRRNYNATFGSHDITSRITIEVDPVVTPKQLAGWWRSVRCQLFDRHYRPMSGKHLELARFAAGRPASTTWDEDRLEWNRSINDDHPSWRYEDRRNFRRDALAAVRRLVFAGIRPPS